MPDAVAGRPDPQVFGDLWSTGDFNQARGRLLHTTGWVQHGRTAYSGELIGRHWMRWHQLAGRADVAESVDLQGAGQRVFVYSMRPEGTRSEVRIALWTWTNDVHFRHVICIIDTAALARARGLDETDVITVLPTPDPLVISEYDHGAHPHTVDVSPLQLAELPAEVAGPVDGWWRLWTQSQLPGIDRHWAEDAEIWLPGRIDATDREGLRQFFTQEVSSWDRRTCQPESVVFQDRSVAILWHMDCDIVLGEQTTDRRRVRIPMISVLDIDEQRIQRETLVCDLLAIRKTLAT